MKATIKFWKPKAGNFTRYYVAVDGVQAGYIQESEAARGSSYYDNHRKAKGDYFAIKLSDTLTNEVRERLLGKFSVKDLEGNIHFDMPAIKRVAKGQPTIKGAKIAYSEGEEVAL